MGGKELFRQAGVRGATLSSVCSPFLRYLLPSAPRAFLSSRSICHLRFRACLFFYFFFFFFFFPFPLFLSLFFFSAALICSVYHHQVGTIRSPSLSIPSAPSSLALSLSLLFRLCLGLRLRFRRRFVLFFSSRSLVTSRHGHGIYYACIPRGYIVKARALVVMYASPWSFFSLVRNGRERDGAGSGRVRG